MPKPVGMCLAGAGAIAGYHLEAYTKLGGIQPRWVVSKPASSAEEFARRWRFAAWGDELAPALADPEVELVHLTSPSPLHAEQARLAMQSGKDVIVEIPVALSWSDAQSVASTARQTGRRVWVCHTLRSTPALRLVRDRVASGQLRLTHIAGFFSVPRRRNQGMGGVGIRTWIDNLLWHHGCHQIDAALWVLGMPPIGRVQALFGQNHPHFGMTQDVSVQLRTTAGVLISQSLSYNVERGIWRLQFIGHEDVLTFEDGRLTNEAGHELVCQSPLSDLTVQDGELLAAFRTGQPCEYELERVLPTMEILGRAQHSADSNS